MLGAYSETWPLNCPKSDKIVRGFADYLAADPAHQGLGDIGMLFLLSTGEDKDLEVVREWARKAEQPVTLRLVPRLRRHPAVRILPAHRRPGGAAEHPEVGR